VIVQVEIGSKAKDGIRRLPKHVVRKLMAWVDGVETLGLEEMRKIPGYHDEPLHGQRKGQRSIRLSRSCRAIYVIATGGEGEIVRIAEVMKHDY
jgi:proteic killer suppression protein